MTDDICFDIGKTTGHLGVLPGILGGGVSPTSPNPDPISDQHPLSDQTSKIHNRFQTWPLGRN